MKNVQLLPSRTPDAAGHRLNGEQIYNVDAGNQHGFGCRLALYPWIPSHGPVRPSGVRSGCNLLLDSLAPSDLCRLKPYLGSVGLRRGEILGERVEQAGRIWFPETCVVSLVVAMSAGNGATVGLIGHEGAVGNGAAGRVVQVSGTARFLSAVNKQAALHAVPDLRQLLLRHADALHGQIVQLAACNALHPAEARLARFLLSVADRVEPHAPLPLTHEDIAHALGVQRKTVTASAAAIQRMGLITYRRGAIEIQKRACLEAVACECYSVVHAHYERLLARRLVAQIGPGT